MGATAHHVTAELDEGPIIEQEVIRVDHTYGPDAVVTAGRDAENLALARAVTWHGQHRILLNNDRTIVSLTDADQASKGCLTRARIH